MNRGIEQYYDTKFKQKPLQSESGISVRDLEGNEYPLQATITYDKELNGNQSISFRILPSKVNTFIHDMTEMWEVVADTDYKIIYCKKRGSGDKLNVEIKAIPVFFDTFDTQRIYEEYNEHMTAQLCFNRIFQDSGYNVVLNGTFEAVQWEGFGAGDTRLTLFKNALNRYKAEFTVSGNTVTIENLIGRDTQFMYRYKLNASNIVQENDASAYWTYAKGYGNYGDGQGGEDWKDAKLIREYTSPIASLIGKREAPPIKNGSITTNSTMDEQLKTLVDESLKISVSADIHDLKKYPLAQPMVGDRAYLIDERIGLETEIRIQHLSITKDWKGNVLNLQAQFGSPNIVKRHQSNLQTAIGNITDLLEGKIKLPFSVLDNAVAEATKALQRMESQLSITENGSLMSVDKNNPNNVVVFNAAGLGVSDDGGATFKNAITGRGINASVIVAGALNTDYVLIGGGNANNYTEMNGGRIRSEGKFTREFGTGETAEYHAYTESWNGVYRSGLISKTANGQTLTNITRWTSLTDKGLTTQREVHSGSSDYRGARFIDLFADETLTSDVIGQGMHIYSGQNMRIESGYNIDIITPNNNFTTVKGGGLAVEADGTILALRRKTPFTTDSGALLTFQSSDQNWQGSVGVPNSDRNTHLVSYFGDYIILRARTQVHAKDTNNENFIEFVGSGYKRNDGRSVYINGTGSGVTRGAGDIGTTNINGAPVLKSSGIRVLDDANSFYVAVNESEGELRVTNLWGANDGTDIGYRPVRASDFYNSSSITLKTNINDLPVSGLDVINNLQVKEYIYQSDVDAGNYDNWQVGVISELSPEIASRDGKAVNHNTWLGYLTKSQQEEYQARKQLEQRVADLELIVGGM
jgi:hypothetical protein